MTSPHVTINNETGYTAIDTIPVYCSVHFVDEDGELTPVTNVKDIPATFDPSYEDIESRDMGLWMLHFLPLGIELYHVALRIVDDQGREIQIEAEGA